MPEQPPDSTPSIPAAIHGVWFWKLAIFEGISSTVIVMGTAICAAGATWNTETFKQMDWWQWWLFWLSIVIGGLKNVQSFVSQTVSTLTQKAKESEESKTTVTLQTK